MLKKHLLQRLTWRQAPKNIKMHFPGAITHRLSTHNPPICFHWCILMLYAVFDNFHALANPIRQDIIRGGPKIDVFVFFWPQNLNFSRPMRFHDLYIGANRKCEVFHNFKLRGKFKLTVWLQLSVFYNVNIELLVTKTRSYIVYSLPNNFPQYMIV